MDDVTPSFEPSEYAYLKRKLTIDLLSLDEEYEELPVLIQRASEYTSQAIEKRDEEKEKLAQVRALVADSLRRLQLPSGKYRSEAQIDSEIDAEPEMIAQLDRLRRARLDASLWMSVMEGWRTKSNRIEDASRLIISGYITQSSIIDRRREDLRK